jgi:hypothetical protein
MPTKSRMRELAGSPPRISVAPTRAGGRSGSVPGTLGNRHPVGASEVMDNSAKAYADPPMQLGKKGSTIPGVTLPGDE